MGLGLVRRVVLLSLAAGALTLGAAGGAQAQVGTGKSIDIPYSEITEMYSVGGNCGWFHYFLQIGEVKGATSYSVLNRFNGGSYTVSQSGPPFPDDDEQGDGYHWVAPKGTHRFGATGGSGGGPCPDYNSAWTPDYVRANFADDKPRIVGSTTEADGKPVPGVKVSITGASSTSGTTNLGGVYSVSVKKGGYHVRAPEGFCVTGIAKCTTTKTLTVKGTEDVSFVRRDPPLILSGTIRDEFNRGLGGVRVSVTGPEAATTLTDAGGRYELRLQKPGTYGLTAVAPKPHGPQERYFIVRNGQPTEGTAADVTLNKDTSPVTVDWELDRKLEFSLTTADPALADGFSRAVTTLRALTQRGDPAPGVELRIDPPADAVPRAVICTTGAESHPLWPSLLSDGSVSPAGIPFGPDSTTNSKGEVTFRIFPGTDGRPFTINGSRRTGAFSSFSLSIPFVPSKSRQFNRDQLARALFEGNTGFGFFGDESVVFETLAVRQRNDADALSGIDAVPVFTVDSKRQGILFYSRGVVPDNSGGSPRVIAPTDAGFVLENTLLQRVTSIPDLPTLRDWAKGETVAVDGADGRTFLGWPIPTTAGGGLGTCLDNGVRGERFVFAAHSPVRLLVTDKQGHQLGTDSKGTRHGDVGGTVTSDGKASYVIVPDGSYTLTVIGTGSGPVTLESRHDGVTTIARFTARKGATAKLNVVGGGLPKSFKFAGQSVKSQAGVPLIVKGLPKRLKAGQKQKVTLTVTDPLGGAVPTAALEVSGAAGSLTAFADAKGRITLTLPAAKKGKVTFAFSAPDLLPLTAQAKVGK